MGNWKLEMKESAKGGAQPDSEGVEGRLEGGDESGGDETMPSSLSNQSLVDIENDMDVSSSDDQSSSE